MVTIAVLLVSASIIIIIATATSLLLQQTAYAHGGLGFKIKNLSDNDGSSVVRQLVVSGRNVYVAWEDDTNSPGIPDIFFRRSTDGGKTFGSTENLSGNDGSSVVPQIAISGRNNVYVVWQDDTSGNLDIFFKRSTDGGKTFGNTENLSDNDGESREPDVEVSGRNVYLVWQDNTPGNSDIFFRRSTDSGDDFDRTKNLSDNDGTLFGRQIAALGGDVYVVRSDRTPGNDDAFFRLGST
jgi:hypothetical protein